MNTNPLVRLSELGQSIWLDFIDRPMLEDGSLQTLIDNDRLAGLTSNPAIFEKAIRGGKAYEASIQKARSAGSTPADLYDQLVLSDIAHAADIFHPVYKTTGGKDGYVSIEVSPLLARDTEATLIDARELWRHLGRPNIMIKVPGTVEGVAAARQLLIEGINVNVTLLFSVERYMEVLSAYMDALETRRERGLPLNGIASVASFFLSRIDVKVDALLDDITRQAQETSATAEACRGQAAIASAAMAYRHFEQTMASEPQRLLWASTGTKDPLYSDIKYVSALVAPATVNTLPPETLSAFREQGEAVLAIEQAVDRAPDVMQALDQLGIDMAIIDTALEQEGIEKFVKPYLSLLETFKSLLQ
jgi:transaldolase